jgi:hypothetical protein
VLKQTSLYSPELTKIALGLAQTQVAIWSTSNFFSIVLILTVVFPEAYGTNFVMAPTEQRLKLATRTLICLVLLNGFVDIFKHASASIRSSNRKEFNKFI